MDNQNLGKAGPAVNILRYFSFMHLPEKLQGLSKEVHDLAMTMNSALPECAEKAAGMRKLLEAKDCFVRAALEK